jgi:hypothetical protein
MLGLGATTPEEAVFYGVGPEARQANPAAGYALCHEIHQAASQGTARTSAG